MSETKTVGDATTESVLFSLLRTARSLEEAVERALIRAGMSGPRFGVLSELAQATEPRSRAAIASRTGRPRSEVDQLLHRLEVDGLVRRTSGGDAHGGGRVVITRLGEERLRAAAARLDGVQRAFAGAMSGNHEGLERALAALRGGAALSAPGPPARSSGSPRPPY